MSSSIVLASGAENVKIWHPPAFYQSGQYDFPLSTIVNCLSWSSSGRSFMCTPSPGDHFVYFPISDNTIGDGDVRKFIAPEPLSCAAFSNSTSRILGLGCTSGKIHLWDMKNKKSTNIYNGHPSRVTCLTFDASDGYIASGSCNGNLLLHNLKSSQAFILRDSLQKTQSAFSIRKVQYNRNKKSLLGVASNDGGLTLWDTNKREVITSYPDAHVSPTSGFVFSPLNDVFLISVGLDKRICCYDLNVNQKVRTITCEAPLESIDIMTDGKTIAVGSTRGKIYIYDLSQSSVPLQTIDAHATSVISLSFRPVQNVDFSKDGSTSSDKKLTCEHSEVKKSVKPPEAVDVLKEAPKDPFTTASLKIGEDKFFAFSPVGKCTEKSSSSLMDNGMQANVLFSSACEAAIQPSEESTFDSYSDVPNSQKEDEVFKQIFNKHTPDYQDTFLSSVFGSPEVDEQLKRSTFVVKNLSSTSCSSNSKHLDTVTKLSPPLNREALSLALSDNSKKHSMRLPVEKFNYTFDAISSPHKNDGKKLSSTPLQMGSTVDPPSLQLSSSEQDGSKTDVIGAIKPSKMHMMSRQGNQCSKTSLMSQTFNSMFTGDVDDSVFDESKNSCQFTEKQRAHSSSQFDSHFGTDKKECTNKTEDKKKSPDVRSLGDGVDSGASGFSTPQAFQMEYIKQMIQDTKEEFHDSIHRIYMTLKIDMIKQFHVQLYEMQRLLEKYSVNQELLEEVERLREENRQLRANF